VGKESREFVYEMTFPEKTGEGRDFVEHLWARRKVGYLLDQIRANGEKKELVDEVVLLAKKYGITTPYTSYLIVPDGPMPVVNRPGAERPNVAFGLGRPGGAPPALTAPASSGGGASWRSVDDFARDLKKDPGKDGEKRSKLQDELLRKEADAKGKGGEAERTLREALELKIASEAAAARFRGGDLNAVQSGKLGVDLSVYSGYLRSQTKLTRTAVRQVYGRSCLEIGGVWIDDGFTAKTPTLVVKAQSDAYFRLLERQPKLKEVFQLGNYLVWVAPSGTALVIDTGKGKDKLSDEEIDKLFVVKK
jgi:Ca-activated chloride channel family protein